MDTMTVNAPAKVNLCLAVEYPPQDGYHALTSVFQELDLYDTLEFRLGALASDKACLTQAGTPVLLDCGPIDVPVQDNLIFRAVDAAEQACGVPMTAEGAVEIRVEKRIPAGGGLGGGSSDAAAALKAYAQVTGLDPLDERLTAVARDLGADVAFFLYGGAALMDGRGDTLVRRLPSFPLPIVLMGEDEGISTAKIYHDFDANPPAPGDAFALAEAMEADDAGAELLARLCTNNLEPAACAALPRLGERVKRARRSQHALNALVTGSGATSYAICPDLESACAFEAEIAPHCAWTHVANPNHTSRGQAL